MRNLLRAVRLFLGSRLTWRTCRRLGASADRFHLVERDGFHFVEPKGHR